MSSRFLLVPEDMYNGLLSSSTSSKSSPKESINLSFAKQKLEGVKKARRLNKSAKNVLYNQELRRVLKIRKEEEEKPVKVELAYGSKPIGHSADKGTSVHVVDPDTDEVTTVSTADSGQPILRSTSSSTLTHSGRRDSSIDEEEEDTVLEQAIERVSSQKARYGITPTGEILDSNRVVVPNSDFKRSIKSIVTPTRGPTPPGTEILKGRISTDPWLNGLAVIATPLPQLSLSSSGNTSAAKTPTRPKRNRRAPSYKPNTWGGRP
jgi:hypothetical protein